jgi:hypothetical protein
MNWDAGRRARPTMRCYSRSPPEEANRSCCTSSFSPNVAVNAVLSILATQAIFAVARVNAARTLVRRTVDVDSTEGKFVDREVPGSGARNDAQWPAPGREYFRMPVAPTESLPCPARRALFGMSERQPGGGNGPIRSSAAEVKSSHRRVMKIRRPGSKVSRNINCYHRYSLSILPHSHPRLSFRLLKTAYIGNAQ